MLWLAVFLGAAVAVQARQTGAVLTAERLGRLREERTGLEAERATLQRRIRQGTGRGELGDRAERDLGLRLPEDSQFTVLRIRRGR